MHKGVWRHRRPWFNKISFDTLSKKVGILTSKEFILYKDNTLPFLVFCWIHRAFSPTRPHWAELVIESPCPCVEMSAPSGAVFFDASHWPSDHMIRFEGKSFFEGFAVVVENYIYILKHKVHKVITLLRIYLYSRGPWVRKEGHNSGKMIHKVFKRPGVARAVLQTPL